MENLLAEVRKLKEASNNGENANPLPFGGDERARAISSILPAKESGSTESSAEKNDKNLEEMEAMITSIMYLDNLRSTNRVEYISTLKSMGLVDETFDGSDSSKDPLDSMIESLMKLKEPINQFSNNIVTPDGKVMGGEGFENRPKGKTITPESGFVVKTRRLNDDKKIFINVCIHPDIDAPGVKKKLDDKGEEVEGINVPMSVGPGRSEKDKSGVDCIVYDMIVNPLVLNECQNDKTGKYRDFICQLGLQCIEQKYKDSLDRRYKLPKVSYVGKVAAQMIQDRSLMPKIEEVASSKKKVASKAKTEEAKPILVEAPLRDLPHMLHYVSGDNEISFSLELNDYHEPTSDIDEDYDAVRLSVNLFLATEDLKSVELQACPFKLSLKIPGYKPVLYFFPFVISVEDIQAHFQDGRLVIDMPIERGDLSLRPDPGSKPFLVNHALSANDNTIYNYRNTTYEEDSSNNRVTMGDSKAVDSLPEDRFHIALPDNCCSYTGIPQENESSEEYPEDRFHKLDIGSQFIIEQRDKALKEKAEKFER